MVIKIDRKWNKCLVISFAIIISSLISCNHNGRAREEESEENESPAEIFGAFDQWSAMRTYPNATLNAESYFREYKRTIPSHIFRNPNITTLSGDPTLPPATPLSAGTWTPLGPMNYSGRVLSLAFDPTNANVMFAGSASGGLWKTTTGGTGAASGINWTQVPLGFPVLGIPAIAINPSNHLEMYIGTGEVYSTGNFGIAGQNIRTYRGSYGIGILKSVDGGVTWTMSLNFTNSSVKGVQKIIIDPTTPANVFAATSDGVYRSTNSGGTWTLIHSVSMAMELCIAPGNASIMYVGCGDLGSTGTGIYKSTNATAATPVFTQLTSGLPATINGMIRMSICPDNASIIYASIGKIPGSSGGTAGTTYGLFKSIDAGASWSSSTIAQPQLGSPSSNYIQNQGWYSHDVIAAPTTLGYVYVAEIDILKSTNSGASFTQLSDWSAWNLQGTTTNGTTLEGTSTNYAHADHHHLYFSPFDATYKTIYTVDDGGIFKSTNGGTSFIGLNGGLQTAQIYHKMSVSATNPNFMLCGLQDNATMWYTGTTNCQRTTGGDGFYTAIDPTNDNICYGTYSYLTLYKSTTGAAALYDYF
jgi:hypothetical protein